MKPFFIGIQNFWAWPDKFLDIWGIFGQTISTHFGTESLVHVFHYSTIISTKHKAFISTSQIFIWVWDLNLGRKELGI